MMYSRSREMDMAKVIYFNGETELTSIQPMSNKEFAKRFPGARARKYDGFSMLVGRPVSEMPVYDRAAGRWIETLLPVERSISYKVNGTKHECDARCMNAKGHNCECSCFGKNHGRGNFMCEAA